MTKVAALTAAAGIGAAAVPLGPAVAAGIQDVFVTNGDTRPVPVKAVAAREWRAEGLNIEQSMKFGQQLVYNRSEFQMQASVITVNAKGRAQFDFCREFCGPSHRLSVYAQDQTVVVPFPRPVTTGRYVVVNCRSSSGCEIHFSIAGTDSNA